MLERQPKSALALYYRVLALCKLGRVDEASALADYVRPSVSVRSALPKVPDRKGLHAASRADL